jgi:hypothetical protein
MVIRQNYYERDSDGTVHQLSVGPRSERGISFREMPSYNYNIQRPRETTHIGPRYSTIGGPLMEAYVGDDGHTANLTVGGIDEFASNKNVYRLCVRGKLMCKATNTGYTNYTLFHCVE